ncbi:MAG: M16 family metallopeptidase [Rhizomicrobium sp.]
MIRTALSAAAFLPVLVPGWAHALDVKALAAPKGEEIWYASDRELPMIAMTAALPAGSGYDPQDQAGLANFAAQMLDEGAGALKSNAFQTALSNRAIRLSVSMERDYLIVSLVTLSGNAKDAFGLLGKALAHPRFDAAAVARVRAQILAGISEQGEDPESVARKGFFREWFHDTSYAHPVDGDAASVRRIGVGDLRHFAATHWVRRGLRVAIAGDVDETTLTTLIASAFGGLSATAPHEPALNATPGGSPLTVIDMPVPQSTAVFGLPGILRSDPDYLPAYIANYIAGGGGFASRLTDDVREKRGLTYDISTSLESWHRAGVVLGEVATQRGAMKQTLAQIRATLRTFARNGPTDAELADAKTYLTGSYPLSFGSNVDTADQLNVFERSGLAIDYVRNRNALMNAVTLDQVKRAARRLFDPAKLSVVVAGGLSRLPQAGSAAAASAR